MQSTKLKDVNQNKTPSYWHHIQVYCTWKYQSFFRGDDQKWKTCLTELSWDCWELPHAHRWWLHPRWPRAQKQSPIFKINGAFLLTKRPFVGVQGTWRNKCLTWEKLSYIREGSWSWWRWPKYQSWYHWMKGIFQDHNVGTILRVVCPVWTFTHLMSQLKKSILEPYSRYKPLIQGNIMSKWCLGKCKQHILMVSQTQTSSKRFLMNIFNLTKKTHKSSS